MCVGGTGTSKYLPTLGTKPTVYQKETNGRFLEQFGGVTLEERIINIVEVDPGLMETGDILIGRRISGDSTSWMLLEGGVANHAAMIVADADNSQIKYVIDCPPISEQNLLRDQSGVRKTELNEWLGKALAQDYEIAWLPLDKNLRSFGDLDEAAVSKWFHHIKKSKYSDIHAFFAAIDTAD